MKALGERRFNGMLVPDHAPSQARRRRAKPMSSDTSARSYRRPRPGSGSRR